MSEHSGEDVAATAPSRAERLARATLAKAFRGELVATEAELAERECREYESGEALLERIRQTARLRALKQPRRREGKEAKYLSEFP